MMMPLPSSRGDSVRREEREGREGIKEERRKEETDTYTQRLKIVSVLNDSLKFSLGF